MTIAMTDTRIGDFNQLSKFLEATKEIEFKAQSRAEQYNWMESTLKKFKYFSLTKKKKGLIRSYVQKLTGYSNSQLSRLITKYQNQGRLEPKKYQRHRFNKIYTQEDINLLVEVDNLHLRPNGHAVKRILNREYDIFGKDKYQNLKNISVAHIYRLRKKQAYLKSSCTFTKTTPNPKGEHLGIRKAPNPQGKPGYIRVDTVHQGDKDREKGVYHINSVDAVIQWEVIGATQKISERYLVPVILNIMDQYPFVIKGFHADNGSEYINHILAKLLNKLLIEFTKNRPRKSNDNALVESKNGSVIRKHMGYLFIPQSKARLIHEFYQKYFNDYLNFHRPCGFSTDRIDKKGKITKVYDTYLTPFEKFMKLDNPEQYLKQGITLEIFKEQSLSHSDVEFARIMTKQKLKLFKEIGFAF